MAEFGLERNKTKIIRKVSIRSIKNGLIEFEPLYQKSWTFFSNSHLFMMPTCQISSCHVTQDANSEIFYFCPNSSFNIRKGHNFLRKTSVSVFTQKPQGRIPPPPPSTFKVRAWLNGNKMFYHTFLCFHTSEAKPFCFSLSLSNVCERCNIYNI